MRRRLKQTAQYIFFIACHIVVVPIWAAADIMPPQQSTLVVLKDHAGLKLQWNQPAHSMVRIERQMEGQPTQTIGSDLLGTAFVDTSAKPNVFYTYRVTDSTGTIAVGQGILPSRHHAFVCPALIPVSEHLLGVDRTETFSTPRGEEVQIQVQAPRPAALVRGVSPCGDKPECSDMAAINMTIAEVSKAGGGRIQLDAGRYILKKKPDERPYAHLNVTNAKDIILAGTLGTDGNPATELVFTELPVPTAPEQVIHGLAIGASQRILVRDVVLDWGRRLAIPGRVENQTDGNQRFVLRTGGYDVPDTKQPPELSNINLFNLSGRTFEFRPKSRLGFAPGRLRFDQSSVATNVYAYTIPDQFFPPGEAIAILRSGVAVRVSGGSSDISFERVHVYAGSSGFAIGPDGHGFRLSNVRVTRRPDERLAAQEQPRLLSIRGDSSSRATRGSLIIENSEFAFLDDDVFNIQGGLTQGIAGTKVLGVDEFEFHFAGYDPFPYPLTTGSELIFVDPKNLTQVGIQANKILSATKTFDRALNYYVTRFKFQAPIPELLSYVGMPNVDLPLVALPKLSSPGVLFRGNCVHDTAAGRLVIGTANALIEDNTFVNTGDKAIELSAAPFTWREGPGAEAVVIRRNRFASNGYGVDDYDHNGYLMGRVTGWLAGGAIAVVGLGSSGFVAMHGPNRNIEISNNFIADTRGIGILISAAQNVKLRDNIVVDAGMGGFVSDFDAQFCGEKSKGFSRSGAGQPWCMARVAGRGGIIITHADNVELSNNLMLGNSQPIFVDHKTVVISPK